MSEVAKFGTCSLARVLLTILGALSMVLVSPAAMASSGVCTCTGMDVVTAGSSGTGLAFEAGLRLTTAQMPGATTSVLAQALGANIHQFPQSHPVPALQGLYGRARLNFEVKATLLAGSDPSLCSEYQKTRASMLQGGEDWKVIKFQTDPQGRDFGKPARPQAAVAGTATTPAVLATPANDIYPFSGTRMIYDNHGYLEPSRVKKHYPIATPPEIRWIDAPGQSDLPANNFDGDPRDGFKLEAAFEAVVDVCKCTWEVHIEIDKNGTIVTNPEIRNKDCSP